MVSQRPMSIARPSTPGPGTGDEAPGFLSRDGLERLISVLRADGRTVIGPTVVDGAIAYDEIAGVASLPAGLTDDQAPGRYRLWYSFIPRFRDRLRDAGLRLERERHFYVTLPRPLDRFFPATARRVERWFDRYMDTKAKYLAEGYLAVARKA